MDNENVSKFTTGTFAFSGANINSLEASEYTLVVIALDISYSIVRFTEDLKNGIKNVVQGCQNSPRSDNLMIRIVQFGKDISEFHGFKELNKCVLTDYDNLLSNLENYTSLYDGAVNAIESINTYGSELAAPGNDYNVNGIAVVLTDGLDNHSTYTPNTIREKLNEAVGETKLESLISVLVGVNTGDTNVSVALSDLAQNAGFTKYIDIKDGSPKEFAKLFQFISKSISTQSKNLGTGNVPSAQSLTF